MSTTDDPAEVRTYEPDELEGFETCNGIRATSVGEDGDVLILGHHDDDKTWSAFQAHQQMVGADDDLEHLIATYDIIRRHAHFSNHSEECELASCSCDEEACPACRRGDHGECAGDAECVCPDWDHERDWSEKCTSCECYCDEYTWWVSDVKTGHPVTWFRWSFDKARARREARREAAS